MTARRQAGATSKRSPWYWLPWKAFPECRAELTGDRFGRGGRPLTCPKALLWAVIGRIVAIAAAAASAEWVYEPIAPDKTAGGHGAALDTQDHAHIVYGRDALYYDWEDVDGWHSETADASSAPGSICMVLDGAGRPHVVYVDMLTLSVKYARRDPAGWSIETIAEDALNDNGEVHAAFCLDDAGQPHVAYRTGSAEASQLTYLYKDVAGWHETMAGAQSRMYSLTMGLGEDGRPHLAGTFKRSGSGSFWYVYHAWRGPAGWQSAELNIPGYPEPPQFDASGRLHMVYRRDASWAGANGVAYVLGTEGYFVTEEIYTKNAYPQLAVSRAGVPHVVFGAYYDSPRNLQHWTKVDGAWQQTIVDASDSFTWIDVSGFGLDAADRPCVLYTARFGIWPDPFSEVTKTAWQDAEGWHTREEPSGPNPDERGQIDLLAPGDGRLLVAYSYSLFDAPGTVMYVREEAGWRERVLAEPSLYAFDVHLVPDAQDVPHIVYVSEGCWYARHGPNGWKTEVLEDSVKGGWSGFALDGQGRPCIAYPHSPSRWLGYAVLTDNGWETCVVDSNVLFGVSLVLDPADWPHVLAHIADSEADTGDLLHYWQDVEGWHQETVAPLGSASWDDLSPEIAADQTGGLHICYYDAFVSRALKYGHRTAQGWQLTTVDANGAYVGGDCSLALDAEGRPHIAYGAREPGGQLRYARKDAGGWHITTVDSWEYEWGSLRASLCLSPDGTPHITYCTGDNIFRYAWLDTGGWERIDLERGHAISSLALDAQGRPHIAYCNVHGRSNLAYLWPPMAFHRIDWSAIPSPQDAGVPIPVTLTARNADGEIRTTFTNPVALSAFAPVAGEAPLAVAVGAGTNVWEYPLYARYHDARIQVIYRAEELEGAWTITSLALEVTSPPGQTLEHWTIRLKHTGLTSYSASPEWETDGWTVVYQGDEPAGAAGWRTFAFAAPFEYNGADNLMVDFSFNNASYSSEGACRSTAVGAYRSITAFSDSRDGDPLDWSGASPLPVRSESVPNLMLHATIRITNTVPVSVAPATVGPFVDGVWTGEVTVLEAASELVLLVDDGAGHGGRSTPFDVPAAAVPIILTDDGHFGLSDGCFGFNLQAAEGRTVVVEISTDLLGWLPVQTNTVNGGPVYFSDPASPTHPIRCYRLLQP